MTRRIILQNLSNPSSIPIDVQYCDTFFSRFLGLMFKPSIGPAEGILLVEKRESILDTSIHMLFMKFNITTVWLDAHYKVVDATLARRWRLAYAPCAPAQYVLETHPDRLVDFRKGDQLVFINV
jgi:uncharacterized membrane protein (UPF0127 family)